MECSLNTKVPQTLIVEGNEAEVKGSGYFLSWQAGSRRRPLLSCCGWTLGVHACSVMSDSFATVWTVARHGVLCPWGFVGKDTGTGCPSLLQGTFQAQGLDQRRLHCRRILHLLSHRGSLELCEEETNLKEFKVLLGTECPAQSPGLDSPHSVGLRAPDCL